MGLASTFFWNGKKLCADATQGNTIAVMPTAKAIEKTSFVTRIRIIHNSHWKTNGRKPIANMTHGSSPKAGDYENFRNFPRQIGQSKRFFPHFCYRSKLSSLRTIHEITFLVGNLQGKFPWSVPNSASKQLVSTRLRGKSTRNSKVCRVKLVDAMTLDGQYFHIAHLQRLRSFFQRFIPGVRGFSKSNEISHVLTTKFGSLRFGSFQPPGNN